MSNAGRPIATVDISPQGDLVLELDTPTGLARFRVSSVVLCLASPVFRAMLGPDSNFKEACELRESASSKEPYIMSLGDKNPQALAVILYALHLQNDKVPREVTYQNLYELAVICDKYDCATGVTLWVPLWTGNWTILAGVVGYENWLFIAWAFKIEEVFTTLSKKIILEGFYIRKGGLLLNKVPTAIFDSNVPEAVVKEILRRRSAAIDAIPPHALSFLQRYNTPGAKSICRAAEPSEKCDMIILGSTIKAFQSLGIQPTYDDLLLKSIYDLQISLREIQIHFWETPRKPCTPSIYNPGNCGQHGAISGCGSLLISHKSTCDFVPEFIKGLDEIVSTINGLSLHDFDSRKMYLKSTNKDEWVILKYEVSWLIAVMLAVSEGLAIF